MSHAIRTASITPLLASLAALLALGVAAAAPARPVGAQEAIPSTLRLVLGAADAAGLIREAAGIAEAPDGSVYVTDGAAHRVTRFAPDGTVLDLWGDLGSAEGHFDGPAGIAVASDGSVVVADRGNDRLQRFDARGRYLGRLGGPPGAADALDAPVGVAIAADGTIYATDSIGDRVARFGPDGAFRGALGDTGPASERLDEPREVAVGPDGTVYVGEFRRDRIVRFAADGTRLGHFRSTRAHLPEREDLWLRALAVGADGTVYAVQGLRDVHHFTPGGTETGRLEIAVGGEVVALAAPGSGRLLVGTARRETSNGAEPLVVVEVDARDRPPYRIVFEPTRLVGRRASGDAPGQFEARTGFYPPRLALSAAPDGTLFVADFGQRRVQWFRADGQWLGQKGGYASGRSYPTDGLGVAAAADEGAWVADPVRGALVRQGPGGEELAALSLALPVPLGRSGPAHAVAVAPDGSIYAANAASGAIARVTASGEVLAAWSGDDALEPDGHGICVDWDVLLQPCSAQSLAIAPDGEVIYRLDAPAGRVRLFDPRGTRLADWGGLGANGEIQAAAQGIAVGPGGSVWASDTPAGRVVRFAKDGTIGAVLEGDRALRGPRAAFARPGGLAVGPDGTLFVADRERGRILAFGHGQGDAWRAEYFGNLDLVERPIVVTSFADPVLEHDWGVSHEAFSARFERALDLGGLADAAWELEVAGGVRLWLGDALAVDAWHGAGGAWQGRAAAGADGWVPVRLELRAPVGPVRVRFALEGADSAGTAWPTPSAVATSTPARLPTSGPTEMPTPTEPVDRAERVYVPMARR